MMEENRVCIKCKKEKSINEFSMSPMNKKGKRYRKNVCKPCCLKKAREYDKKRYKRNKEELKNKVFGLLGNKCSCCGESRKSFLQLHHSNGDGGAHNKGTDGMHLLEYYRYLLKGGVVDDSIRLLCANCHFSIHLNDGICEH